MADGAALREMLDARLNAIWEATAVRPAERLQGAAVAVTKPGFDYRFARGRAREDGDADMRPETPFHIASVGKTMTAALAFQAIEEGMLPADALDRPFASLGGLDDLMPHVPALAASGATLRQMLNHTSGLKDAFSDDGASVAADHGGPAPGSLSRHLQALRSGHGPAPDRWPPWDAALPLEPQAGVLNWFIASGAAVRGVDRPGARFHYSDTAYMILALLLERTMGAPYGELLRARIFAPLGMTGSHLAYSAQSPEGWRQTVSDFWMGDVAMFSAGADVSWDWGGGGQISTAGDLALFLRGLLGARLFRDSTTLKTMTTLIEPAGMPEHCTGLGLGLRRLGRGDGPALWGHAGAWSVQAFYCRELDATITGSFNRSMAAHPALRHWVLDVADVLAAA